MYFAVAGVAPFLSPKYDLKKNQNYKYIAEADQRNAFDITKLINKMHEIKTEPTLYRLRDNRDRGGNGYT